MHIKNNTSIDIINSYLSEEEFFYNTWYKNIKNSRFSPFKTEEKLINKENVKIEKIINYLNNSNKLPNLDKELPVEFRGFSKEEIKKREETGETGYSIYLPDEQKIIVDETEVKGLSEYKFSNNNVKPINKQDAANFLFLHELGHAVHHQWSLANQDKLTEVPNKNDEQFINQMIKFGGFKDIPSEQLHSLHSSVLEGYADLYACSMIREIYTANGQKERGEELIKSITQVREDNYNNANVKERNYKYDVVDNLKQHNSPINANIQYKDFNDLNEKIMETNTTIGLKKFDVKLKEYTNPANNNAERKKEEFFYLTSFVNNRIYGDGFENLNVGKDTLQILENRAGAPFKMNTVLSNDADIHYFIKGREFANKGINSGVIDETKENQKIKRPSLSNNNLLHLDESSKSLIKKPTLNTHKKEDSSNDQKIQIKKPKLFTERSLPTENIENSARPRLNPKKSAQNQEEISSVPREIPRPKMSDSLNNHVKKEDSMNKNHNSLSGKNKI